MRRESFSSLAIGYREQAGEITRDEWDRRLRELNKFGKLLAPGGAVLLDVYSLAAFAGREESCSFQRNLLDGFWSAGEYFGFLSTFKYPEEKVVLDKYTIIEKNRQRTVYNWSQYFDRETGRDRRPLFVAVLTRRLSPGSPLRPLLQPPWSCRG